MSLLEEQAAISWLNQRGKILGQDFDQANSIAFANEVSFLEETLRSKTEKFLRFDGQTCKRCPGWNGRDRYCECGTHRVAWQQGLFHSFKCPDVYAGAL